MRNLHLYLLTLAFAAPTLAAPPKKNPDIEKMVKEISAKRIEDSIRKLVSFETRNSLSDTCNICKNIQDVLAAMCRGPAGKNAH